MRIGKESSFTCKQTVLPLKLTETTKGRKDSAIRPNRPSPKVGRNDPTEKDPKPKRSGKVRNRVHTNCRDHPG